MVVVVGKEGKANDRYAFPDCTERFYASKLWRASSIGITAPSETIIFGTILVNALVRVASSSPGRGELKKAHFKTPV